MDRITSSPPFQTQIAVLLLAVLSVLSCYLPLCQLSASTVHPSIACCSTSCLNQTVTRSSLSNSHSSTAVTFTLAVVAALPPLSAYLSDSRPTHFRSTLPSLSVHSFPSAIMIKLKGGDDKNSIMNQAAKRMGLPTLNAKGSKSSAPPNYTSPGSHHAQQSASSSSASAIPDGPTPLAQRLGMPSASAASMGGEKGKKDWSSRSNRIAMGGTVYIKGKSHRDDDGDDEAEIVDDKPKRKLGDAVNQSDEDEDDEEFLAGGDDESRLLAAMREKRLAELRATTGKQQQWLGMGHGVYTDVVQDEFLKTVTGSKYVVCHFYHATFETCKTVDHHLQLLSRTHLPTRFIKINAEKAPFFVTKLQVKMLPTVVLFKDGIAIDRVVGFDELGGSQEFETSVLERRLAKGGVILVKGAEGEGEDGKRRDGVRGSIRSGGNGRGGELNSDDDDDD